MAFTTTAQVRFAHVDPAGIVFYPRYFEMLNGAVEDWFARELGMDFAMMHRDAHVTIPTVRIETEFLSPSRLGDTLDITIIPRRIGRTSCDFTAEFSGDGRKRLRAQVVLVCVDLQSLKPTQWPDNLRAAIEAGVEEPAQVVPSDQA